MCSFRILPIILLIIVLKQKSRRGSLIFFDFSSFFFNFYSSRSRGRRRHRKRSRRGNSFSKISSLCVCVCVCVCVFDVENGKLMRNLCLMTWTIAPIKSHASSSAAKLKKKKNSFYSFFLFGKEGGGDSRIVIFFKIGNVKKKDQKSRNSPSFHRNRIAKKFVFHWIEQKKKISDRLNRIDSSLSSVMWKSRISRGKFRVEGDLKGSFRLNFELQQSPKQEWKTDSIEFQGEFPSWRGKLRVICARHHSLFEIHQSTIESPGKR